MSFWKKTMDYLGLGPDDAYDDYDEQAETEPPARSSARSSGDPARNGSVTNPDKIIKMQVAADVK